MDLEPPPGDFSLGAQPVASVFEPMVVDNTNNSCSYFLDIFSGASSPVSVAVRALHADSIEPVDLIFGQHCDLLDDAVFNNVLDLAASGMIGAALAAPYCSKHSMATLRPNGPKPVRTPDALEGLPTNNALQDLQVQESATIHDRARHILTLVAAKGGIVVIENPLTSMTWLDDLMSAWVRATSPYLAAASACRFGENWQKSWLFCSNRSDILAVGLGCDHPPQSHLNFAGLRLPDGTFYSRLTACYPTQLAQALAQIFIPYLSRNSTVATLQAWPSCLPGHFTPQPLLQRVEDGGGLISTAVWHTPQAPDVLRTLRKQWTTRILEMGLHTQILAHFAKGSKDPPLSAQQLQGFLLDVRDCLHVPTHVWEEALHVAPGQPFRLELWSLILQTMNDPDVSFLDELRSGVRLGVNNDIPASPLWPLQQSTISDDQDLIQCESSWKSALDQPDIVWQLLQEEIDAGFIERVPGGLAQLQQDHQHTAVGKLGLVCAENRPPRLVVDSTVSGVTHNTSIPNRMLLPKISDVLVAAPLTPSTVELLAFTLDVSKAHRRIKIHPQDQGLLCFWYQDVLFKSTTLNFGARASGYFWARVAGLMVRTFHRLLHVKHALFQYVDDLLVLLEATTSPIWMGILTIACQILGIPMSWHKTDWGPSVTWIGWHIDVHRWVVSITPTKRDKILMQIDALLKTSRCDLKTLESLTGRLLWVSSLWETLRPLLGPLYHAMMNVPLTLVSISPHQWPDLLDALQDDLCLSKSLDHPSLRKSVKVLRVANFTLRDREHAKSLHFKSRRIWLGLHIPGSSKRKLLPDTHEALQAWKDVLIGTPFMHNMIPPQYIPIQASADACATMSEAGLGGIIRVEGQVLAWFAYTIPISEAKSNFTWISDSMQKHINVWELLGQFSLAYCLDCALKGRRTHIAVTFACDNTSAEAAHLKALSTSAGMCQILAAFFRFQRIHNIDVTIQHIPGMWNDDADDLSRGKLLPFCTPDLRIEVPWKWLCSAMPKFSPSQARIPSTLLSS